MWCRGLGKSGERKHLAGVISMHSLLTNQISFWILGFQQHLLNILQIRVKNIKAKHTIAHSVHMSGIWVWLCWMFGSQVLRQTQLYSPLLWSMHCTSWHQGSAVQVVLKGEYAFVSLPIGLGWSTSCFLSALKAYSSSRMDFSILTHWQP